MTKTSIIVARVFGTLALLCMITTALMIIATPVVLLTDPYDMSWELWVVLIITWISFGLMKVANALLKENGIY